MLWWYNIMKACDVCHCFRQLKLRSCSKISWYVLVPVILKVDVWVPLEIQVDVSATFVLNICCFCTSRTTSWGEGGFSTSRNTSGCFSTSCIENGCFSTSVSTSGCFATFRSTSGCFSTYRTTSGCFKSCGIKTDVSVPLVLKRMFQHL